MHVACMLHVVMLNPRDGRTEGQSKSYTHCFECGTYQGNRKVTQWLGLCFMLSYTVLWSFWTFSVDSSLHDFWISDARGLCSYFSPSLGDLDTKYMLLTLKFITPAGLSLLDWYIWLLIFTYLGCLLISISDQCDLDWTPTWSFCQNLCCPQSLSVKAKLSSNSR